jgi:hypothetical protein
MGVVKKNNITLCNMTLVVAIVNPEALSKAISGCSLGGSTWTRCTGCAHRVSAFQPFVVMYVLQEHVVTVGDQAFPLRVVNSEPLSPTLC